MFGLLRRFENSTRGNKGKANEAPCSVIKTAIETLQCGLRKAQSYLFMCLAPPAQCAARNPPLRGGSLWITRLAATYTFRIIIVRGGSLKINSVLAAIQSKIEMNAQARI